VRPVCGAIVSTRPTPCSSSQAPANQSRESGLGAGVQVQIVGGDDVIAGQERVTVGAQCCANRQRRPPRLVGAHASWLRHYAIGLAGQRRRRGVRQIQARDQHKAIPTAAIRTTTNVPTSRMRILPELNLDHQRRTPGLPRLPTSTKGRDTPSARNPPLDEETSMTPPAATSHSSIPTWRPVFGLKRPCTAPAGSAGR